MGIFWRRVLTCFDRLDFTKCLEATGGDMGSCGYYLEALSEWIGLMTDRGKVLTLMVEACQAAAKQY